MKRFAILVAFLSSITVNAQNWPSFRGPNGSGVAEGANPPITWDLEKSQNALWKTDIPGLSHSSPIVWGNNIFVVKAGRQYELLSRNTNPICDDRDVLSWSVVFIYISRRSCATHFGAPC